MFAQGRDDAVLDRGAWASARNEFVLWMESSFRSSAPALFRVGTPFGPSLPAHASCDVLFCLLAADGISWNFSMPSRRR